MVAAGCSPVRWVRCRAVLPTVSTPQELDALFRDRCYPDEQVPRGQQARLLIRIARIYSERGLWGDGEDIALCDVCPNAASCWGGLPRSARRRPSPKRKIENGAIVLPWVGPNYKPGGVVAVGINPNISGNDPTTVDIEHGITWDHYIEATMKRGRLTEGGSRFGGHSTRAIALLQDSLDGVSPRPRAPRDLIEPLKRSPRLQTVKCVPRTEVSAPTRQMTKRCPEFLLEAELRVLSPRVVITFGAVPRDGVVTLDAYEPMATRYERLAVGHLAFGRRRVTVFHLGPSPLHLRV